MKKKKIKEIIASHEEKKPDNNYLTNLLVLMFYYAGRDVSRAEIMEHYEDLWATTTITQEQYDAYFKYVVEMLCKDFGWVAEKAVSEFGYFMLSYRLKIQD